MALFRKWFGGQSRDTITYSEFWQWFTSQADGLSEVLARDDQNDDAVRTAFSAISTQLYRIRQGYFFQAGKMDATTSELIISADGHIENIVFVEELINAAPLLKGWKFTAHKQPDDGSMILLNGHEYSAQTVSFLPVLDPDHPDQCVIAFFCRDQVKMEPNDLRNGVTLLVEATLGDLGSIELIDDMLFDFEPPISGTLRHFSELAAYVSAFKAKTPNAHVPIGRNTQNDGWLTGRHAYQSGAVAVSAINPLLLDWDGKASYPWLAVVNFKFSNNRKDGLPTEEQFDKMVNFQLSLEKHLRNSDGNLSVGSFSKGNERDIFYACSEFREASKIIYAACKQGVEGITVTYYISKDCNWAFADIFQYVKGQT